MVSVTCRTQRRTWHLACKCSVRCILICVYLTELLGGMCYARGLVRISLSFYDFICYMQTSTFEVYNGVSWEDSQ